MRKSLFFLSLFFFLTACQEDFIFTLVSTFNQQEVIDGNVYLNDEFLGFTINGNLSVKKDFLEPGIIIINGTYLGRTYENVFYLTNEDLVYYNVIDLELNLSTVVYYELIFLENITNNSVDGEVYLDEKYLGATNNGVLQVKRKELFSGEIYFQAKREEYIEEYYFDLNKSGLALDVMEFIVPKTEVFDARVINQRTIENEIFELVNEERKAEDLNELRWNEMVSYIARQYSEKLLVEGEGIYHTDSLGEGIGSRLKDAEIYYFVAGENLASMSVESRSFNLSEEIVALWMSSPGHRNIIIDRDNLFSDAGVGVACTIGSCIATLNVVSLKSDEETELRREWSSFYELYDTDLDFDHYSVPVNIKVSANKSFNVFVVPSENEWNKYLEDKSYETIESYTNRKTLDINVTAEPNWGIIISTREREWVVIKITIDYSQGYNNPLLEG
ncbi:MAG: hypothetical protein ISS25_01325 [Nanoarchaeota archaeon]|nr:hypothetical protein [DPANN group archaeon]MBL7116454.1 hypothetical protein [Nanoarchaeota archaeon]